MIGKAVRRREDIALLRGEGSYVADIDRPDQLHLAVLRSPHAHAEIRSIDTNTGGPDTTGRTSWREIE